MKRTGSASEAPCLLCRQRRNRRPERISASFDQPPQCGRLPARIVFRRSAAPARLGPCRRCSINRSMSHGPRRRPSSITAAAAAVVLQTEEGVVFRLTVGGDQGPQAAVQLGLRGGQRFKPGITLGLGQLGPGPERRHRIGPRLPARLPGHGRRGRSASLWEGGIRDDARLRTAVVPMSRWYGSADAQGNRACDLVAELDACRPDRRRRRSARRWRDQRLAVPAAARSIDSIRARSAAASAVRLLAAIVIPLASATTTLASCVAAR